MPHLYIIMGSNGAGKSTFGHSYLPKAIKDKYSIFDGDKLSRLKKKEIIDNKVTPSFKEAGRLADEWLAENFELQVSNAIAQNTHFLYEGHFRDDESWNTPERFRKAGYLLNFIFIGLADTRQSELRVFERAKLGGHNVPPHEIEKNFYGNLDQLNKRFQSMDSLQIIDSSDPIPKVLAIFKKGSFNSGVNANLLPLWFVDFLPDIFRQIPFTNKGVNKI